MIFFLACTGDDDDSGSKDSATEIAPVRLLIPASYEPSNGAWDQILAGAADIGLLVANVDNGPGGGGDTAATADAEWKARLDAAKQAGIKVLGYVPTEGGARTVDEMIGDMVGWASLYQVGGIYFADGPTEGDCETAFANYEAVATASEEMMPDSVAMLDYNGNACESYMPFMDVAGVFAGDATGFLAWEPQEWAKNYPPEKFSVAVHGVAEADVDAVIDHARARNIRYMFITDDAGNALPSYWESLLQKVP